MLVLKSYKNINGIALVAAVVVTLIVSLVAVAIASTALANRHLSGSVYDQTSSYVNAQAGLNLGETILLTAESDELENVGTFSVDGSNDKFLAHEISSECLKPNDLSAAGNCFWWLGDVIHSDYNNSFFLSHIGSDEIDAGPGITTKIYNYPNANTYFKVERRLDKRPAGSQEMNQSMGRRFFRATSIGTGNGDIGTGNGEGLTKLQGQIAVLMEVDTQPVFGGDGGSGGCPSGMCIGPLSVHE